MRLHSTMAIFTFLNSTTECIQSTLLLLILPPYFKVTQITLLLIASLHYVVYREQRYDVNSINPSKTKTAFFTVNNNAARMQYLL